MTITIPRREFIAGIVPAQDLDRAMQLLRGMEAAGVSRLKVGPEWRSAAAALTRAGVLTSVASFTYELHQPVPAMAL